MSDLLNKSIETAKEISSNMVPTNTDFQNAKLDQLEKTVIRDPSKDPNSVLTTEWGTPISNNTTWMKAGQRGPSLLEDMTARDKIHHFDHERIPERVVHARGAGFHGVFECTDPLDESICAAPMLATKGKTTPYFTRFSTVLGNRGSPDTVSQSIAALVGYNS
jgi:catalase